jgi:hypothetical protein
VLLEWETYVGSSQLTGARYFHGVLGRVKIEVGEKEEPITVTALLT